MPKLNIILIVFTFDIASQQQEQSIERYFEKASFTKSDYIPMLNRKVFGGQRVSVGEHPYVASVRRLYAHLLTGAVLTRNLVITVAHPLHLVNPSELGVVVGENYSDRGTSLLTVVVVIIHEHFDPYTLHADIALLRLYEELLYRVSVKPISLISPYSTVEGLTAFVTGWGRCDRTGKELCLPRSSKYFRGEKSDPMLRTVKFTFLRNPHCDAYVKKNGELEKGMLCVGPARAVDPLCPCLGVPGAPLVVGSRLAGLLSWGFGCGYTHDLPLIYTDIKQYQGWLIHNVPVLKKITKQNLTQIFKITKLHFLSEGLTKTRMQLPLLNQFPVRDIQAIEIDSVLSKLKGKVYDVRDFLNEGRYRNMKISLYNSIKVSHERADVIEQVGRRRTFDVKPFLGRDAIASSGLVLTNGSLLVEDSSSPGQKINGTNVFSHADMMDVPVDVYDGD